MFAADLLQGRGVLITGGGSGLGLALAKRCAALGARVAICGRSEERLPPLRRLSPPRTRSAPLWLMCAITIGSAR